MLIILKKKANSNQWNYPTTPKLFTNQFMNPNDDTELIAFNDSGKTLAELTALAGYQIVEYTGINLNKADVVKPVLPLTNINITNAVLNGAIYWIAENSPMVITGDVSLPDGSYMVMAERVIDGSQVVDDARFKAIVSNGKMTINAIFKTTGNYLFSADRLNRGLDRIGANVHLGFDDIEFDVYL